MSEDSALPTEAATPSAEPIPAPAEPVLPPPPPAEPIASPAKAEYPFRVLPVLSTALRITKHNFVPFFLFACMLQIPAVLVQLRDPRKHVVLVFLVATGINALMQAVVAYGTIMELQGSRPSTRACIATGFAQLGRVLGVTVVCSLAIGGAMLLLVIPGIIVSLMLYVVVPVTLVEGLGIRAAMRRSRELTNGHKGVICLIVMLGGALALLIKLYAYPQLGHDAAILWRALVSALSTMFFAVTVGVAYFQLRKLHDGIDVPELATAFARIRK